MNLFTNRSSVIVLMDHSPGIPGTTSIPLASHMHEPESAATQRGVSPHLRQ